MRTSSSSTRMTGGDSRRSARLVTIATFVPRASPVGVPERLVVHGERYDLITRCDARIGIGSPVWWSVNDPVGHPLSIHNWVEIFDYTAEWATHASIQAGVVRWRSRSRMAQRWDKPIVVDEFGYEGDLDQGWGNLTAEEVVRRFWEATLRVRPHHGETSGPTTR